MAKPQALFDTGGEDTGAPRSVDQLLDTYAPRPKKGIVESTLRGAAQGLSADFADEIGAGLESAFTDKTYEQARDESRAEYANAKKDNPMAYGAGQMGGTLGSLLIPGVGELGAGEGLAAAAARGAAYGGLAGAGASNADLIKGDVGGLAEDAAKGAATGAAAGGALHGAAQGLGAILSPLAKKVGTRVEQEADQYATGRLVDAQRLGDEAIGKESEKFAPLLEKEPEARAAAVADPKVAAESGSKALTDRALDRLKIENGNGIKRQVFGRQGVNEEGIKDVLKNDRELRAAIDASTPPGVSVGSKPFEKGEGPAAALEIVDKRLAVDGEKLDGIYQAAQDATPGGRPQAVLAGMRKLRDEFADTGASKPLAAAVDKEMKRIQADYIGKKGTAIPLQKMRKEYRDWQDKGFAGANNYTPTAAQELNRGLANVWREALHEEIERVASRNPNKMGPLLEDLRATNKRVSSLMGIRTLLDEWATNYKAAAPTMGEMTHGPLKQIKAAIENKALDMGRAVVGNAAAANARRASPQVMAQFMATARSGGLSARVIKEAIDAGIPPETVEQVRRQFGSN